MSLVVERRVRDSTAARSAVPIWGEARDSCQLRDDNLHDGLRLHGVCAGHARAWEYGERVTAFAAKADILRMLHGSDDPSHDDGVEAFDIVRRKLVVGGVQLLREMETLVITRDESIDVISRSWAAYDLMPPDPARTNLRDEDGLLGLVVDAYRAQTAPLRSTAWMPGPHSAPRAASADARLGARNSVMHIRVRAR